MRRARPRALLSFQSPPSAAPILRQPAIDRGTIDAENARNNFRAFTVLNATHRTNPALRDQAVAQLEIRFALIVAPCGPPSYPGSFKASLGYAPHLLGAGALEL